MVHPMAYEGRFIWGATVAMIRNFLRVRLPDCPHRRDLIAHTIRAMEEMMATNDSAFDKAQG